MKRNSPLRAVVKSKREKETRDRERAYNEIKSKEILSRTEVQKDRKASKEEFPILSSMGVDDSIIEMAFRLSGGSEQYDDLMSRTVAKESANIYILSQYIDQCVVTKMYAREAIINFIDEHVHIVRHVDLPSSISIDNEVYEKKEKSSYIYGNDADTIMSIIRNIPEMFHYLRYYDETYTDDVIKSVMVTIMSDFMKGFVTKISPVNESLIHEILAGGYTPTELSENKRDAIGVVIKMDKLPYNTRYRFVEKTLYSVGFIRDVNVT